VAKSVCLVLAKKPKPLLKTMVANYRKSAPELADWLEANPPEHRARIRTSNAAERLNQEIKRRTRVARAFPNTDSLLRLVSAILSEIRDEWESSKTYLNMNPPSGTGVRFVSDLENGKETCELGKALKVIENLGIDPVFKLPFSERENGGRGGIRTRGTITVRSISSGVVFLCKSKSPTKFLRFLGVRFCEWQTESAAGGVKTFAELAEFRIEMKRKRE